MLLSEFLRVLGEVETGTTDREVTDVVYDSRLAKPGCVFVCLRGSSSDGHRYASQAATAGAVAVIAEEPVDAGDVPVILVPDTKAALAVLSAEFFGNPARHDIKVIGITGTKGKTTTAYMVRSILEAAGHKTGIIGTIGVQIGDTVIASFT